MDRPPSRAIASSLNPDVVMDDVKNNNIKNARSTERRQRKIIHRRQNTQAAKRKPPPLPPSHSSSVIQRPHNNVAIPSFHKSRTRRPTADRMDKGSKQQRCYKVTDHHADREHNKSCLSILDRHVSPSSSDMCAARARPRRKHKDAIRQKRRRDGDSAYQESTGPSQPTKPISSRLRKKRG